MTPFPKRDSDDDGAARGAGAAGWRASLRRAFVLRWLGSGVEQLDLRWRFRIVVIAFGFPFLGYIVWSAALEAAHEKDNLRARAGADATLMAARLSDHVGQVDHLLATIALSVGPRLADVASVTETLEGVRSYVPKTVDDIAVLALDGSRITSLDRHTASVSVADRTYFRDVLAHRDLAFQGPLRSRTTGTDVIVFACPVFNAEDRLIAVIAMSIDTRKLITQLDPTNEMTRKALVAIVLRDGTIVARSIEPEVWNGRKFARLDLLAQAFERRAGAFEAVGLDGTERLTGYAVSADWPWLVTVGQPLDQVTGPIGSLLLVKLAIGLGLFTLALLVAGRIGSWTTRPLVELTADTERLRHGHLAHRSRVETGGEIATLAANINRMAAAIEQRDSELAASRAQLRAITDNIPEHITYVDRHERYRFVNAQSGPFPDVAPADLIGRTLREVRGEATYEALLPSFKRAMAGVTHRRELSVPVAGVLRHYQIAYVPDFDAAREVQGVYAFAQDITERKTAELLLQESQKRLVTITDNMPAMICYVDETRRFRFANRAFERWFGRPLSQIVGQPFERTMPAEAAAKYDQYFLRGMQGETLDHEFRVETEQHGARWLKGVFIPDMDETGRVVGVYGMIHNVTKAKEAEQRLTRLAQYDTLTGLANRHQFNETLAQALDAHDQHGRPLALMFLDIDHFKQVNDRFGHLGGDLLLKQFAQRLAQCVRPTDAVARLAGDEFVVLLEGLHSDDEPQFIARKIIAAVDKPFLLDDHFAKVSTSIGIAMRGARNEIASDLMKRADEALYEAKHAGRNTFRLAS